MTTSSDRSAALLGSWEEMVLLAVLHAGETGYGMKLRMDIERRSGRAVTVGAVYATLDRLERKGYLSSRTEPGDPTRRGRPRRCFTLRTAGISALREARSLHERMWDGVELAHTPATESRT